MLPRLSTLSRDLALAAKSVPVGRIYPLLLSLFVEPDADRVSKLPVELREKVLTSDILGDGKLAEECREKVDMSLPRDSRGLLWLPSVVAEPCDALEAADKHRSKLAASGAPRAGLGDMVGDGDSQRSVGVVTSDVVAMT